MRLLIADDWEARHVTFGHRYFNHECTHVRSVDEAIQALDMASQPFDVALLDHDFGTGFPNGTDLAKFIAALPPEKRPKKVIVHSWYDIGAREMVDILTTVGIPAGVKPFTP